MMRNDLQGRVALVTGGARGIGYATASQLAACGSFVAVVDNGCEVDGRPGDMGLVKRLAEEMRAPGGARGFALDASDCVAMGDLIADLVREHGRLDIIVNCAGTLCVKPIWEVAPEEWEEVMASHVRHTYATCAHAARHWRARADDPDRYGRVINMTAATGLVGRPDMGSSHSAAKGAIAGMSVSLAHELYPLGATVNAVAAANVRGRMADLVGAEIPEERAGVDPGDPRHCGTLIAYLCTPDAQWITGQVFRVIGGMIGWYKPWSIQATIERRESYWSVGDLELGMRELLGVYPDVLAIADRFRHKPNGAAQEPRTYAVQRTMQATE